MSNKASEAEVVQLKDARHPPGDGARSHPSALRFVEVNTLEQRKIFKEIVEKYHSYVPTANAVGRRIDFVLYIDQSVVGAIGLASAPILLRKSLLEYFRQFTATIMKNQGQKVDITPIYNQIANNWRFTLTPDAPKNAGSRSLSLLALLGSRRWKQKYGDELHWILSFVGAGKTGLIYRAAGWKLMGQTAGRQLIKPGFSAVGKSQGSKERPLVDLKLIFLKEIGHPEVLLNMEQIVFE